MGSSDGAVLHAWALAGRGLAWRSMWEVSEDLANGRLASVLDEFAAPPNGIYAVFPQRKHLPARVHALVDHLRDAYRDWLIGRGRRRCLDDAMPTRCQSPSTALIMHHRPCNPGAIVQANESFTLMA